MDAGKWAEGPAPVVGVIGAADADRETAEIAFEVGAAVSDAGWNLVCGGGGGVMEAACRGFRLARDRNGGRNVAVGVAPSEDRAWANRSLDLVLPTGMGIARNALVARAAWALVAVGGGSGTLSEIALGWQMGRPIVAMAGSGGWAARLAGEALDDRRSDRILPARSAAEAVEILGDLFGER